MSAPKPDWLQMPELEEELRQIDALPADLDRLTESVRLIADALEKKVKIELWQNALGPVRSFKYSSGKSTHYQGVSVQNGRYVIAHQIAADRFHTEETSTAQLAWKILGFPFSPADARARLERAKELGISYAPGVVPLGMPRAKPQKKIAAATRKPGTSRAKRLSGVPIGIGIAAGISIGDATHNVVLGVAIGALIGVAVNGGMQKWKVS